MTKIIDLYIEAEKHYNQLLISYINNKLETFFPLFIKFSKPLLTEDRNTKNEKIEYLTENSKSKKGYGYKIIWKETIKTRNFGDFTAPETVCFENALEYLKFIKKEDDFDKFKQNIQLILEEIPQLKQWILENVAKINTNSNNWYKIIKVCRYFLESYEPNKNLYIRELPIEIHTKFIEENKSLFDSIFTSVLPKHKIDENYKALSNFEKRYYLNYNHPTIRFRILDAQLYINNLSDLSVLIYEFENLQIDCDIIFITENLMNFLAFPKTKKSIVIWGEGNKVNALRSVNWLKGKQFYYWGDIDFAGLHILSNLREYFVHVNSLLMNVEIFEKYENFSVIPDTIQNMNLPKNLNNVEQELFNKLKLNPDKKHRLEQEHIPQMELLKFLSMISI